MTYLKVISFLQIRCKIVIYHICHNYTCKIAEKCNFHHKKFCYMYVHKPTPSLHYGPCGHAIARKNDSSWRCYILY